MTLSNDFLSLIAYQWAVFPILESIFFIIIDRLVYGKPDFKIPFQMFLFVYFLSFFLIAFDIFDTFIYSISRQFAAVLIIILCIVLIVKERKVSNWLFLLSMGSFSVAGFAQNFLLQEPNNFSNTALVFFSFCIGFIFLSLIFAETKIRNEQEGIDLYFNIQSKLKKVESDLYQTEQRYRQLVENINEGIWVLDKHFQTTYVNSYLATMLGYTPDDMAGKTIYDFMDDDSKTIAQEKLSIIHDLNNFSCEFNFLRKDNFCLSVSVNISPLNGEKGVFLGAIAAVQDVSERKKMEHDLSVKLDKLQKSELATLNIMEDLQNTIHSLTVAEMEIRDKNTQLQKINTQLASTREELTILNRDLELKVKERTAEVEKLLKQKDEFVSQLGHDLKTPLTPLNILIPIVIEQEKDPKIKELLNVISNNIQYMKNLVIKTLELAQLNSSNTNSQLQDVALSVQLNDILDMEKILNQGKNVVFENNIPLNINVKADLLEIRELFDNLISNSIKYSQENTVKITFDAKQKDDYVFVSVQDNGIGIEPNHIKHVFDEFYKVDYSRHDLQSTGLGLSICKKIIEKHGGTIWVESLGKGKGSTFYFTLLPSENNYIR